MIGFEVTRPKPAPTRVLGLAFSGLLLTCAAGPFPEAPANPAVPPPTYRCPRVERGPVLSGRVDDPLWLKAPAVHLNRPVDGKPGRYATTVRMLYDGHCLYVAFECEDEHVWGTLTTRDSAIYGEECVELFISPSGKMRQYYELNVSPRGTVFDALILNGRSADGGGNALRSWTDYSCEGWVTRVHIQGELGGRGARGWSAEYSIPFAAILGSDNLVPQPGETWLLNLYRIDAPEPGQPELYAWSPTGANDFHRPWRFGALVFEP